MIIFGNCVFTPVRIFTYHIYLCIHFNCSMPLFIIVCTCVYLYVCIYMCVYIRVTYTHRSRAYFHVYLRTISYASSSIYQHSLIHFNVDCLLVCVSWYALICIRLCLCLCLYAMTASVPVLSIFLLYTYLLNVQCWAKLHNLLAALHAVKKPSMQLITLFSCQL